MRGHIRPRGKHWAIVIDTRDPETGERKRKWHSFRGSRREAQTECARLIGEHKAGKVNALAVLTRDRHPALPDVPLVMDLAVNDRERQILKLVLSRQQMGWPFLAPPGLPADRARALRQAFDHTMKDPEFLAEATQRQLEVNPMSGVEIEKLLAELYATPPDVIAATKAVIAEGAR